MAKNKKSPVVMDKGKLLLPRMEFCVLEEATGEGFYLRELGGRNLFRYREKIKGLAPDGKKLSEEEAFDVMIDLVFDCAVNEDATPYFSSREEAEAFGDVSFMRLMVVVEIIKQLSGMEVSSDLKNALNSSSTGS